MVGGELAGLLMLKYTGWMVSADVPPGLPVLLIPPVEREKEALLNGMVRGWV